MPPTSKEARVILALEAIQNNGKLSLRAVAKLYDIPESTLRHRRSSIPTRRDTPPNSKKLTQSEEEAVVRYILELDSRSFLPRLRGIEDMANQLLRIYDAPLVGKLWVYNFVKR